MRTALAAVLVVLAGPAAAGEKGQVDWEHKTVQCTGSGAANLKDADGNAAVARIGAEKAARLDALRSCMETLSGIQLETGKSVGSALSSDAALSGKVQGLVRGFRVVGKPRYYSDGGVEIDVEVPLSGALSDALLPRPAEVPATPAAADADGGSTSLVVDARGQKIVPALAPRVKDEAGHELYGPAVLADPGRRAGGAAAYAPDLEAAKRAMADRVGPRPLVVRAVRVEGSDVVISAADAAALAGQSHPFLAQGKVVILAD